MGSTGKISKIRDFGKNPKEKFPKFTDSGKNLRGSTGKISKIHRFWKKSKHKFPKFTDSGKNQSINFQNSPILEKIKA